MPRKAVRVKLGKKDFSIPYVVSGEKLVRITDHPLDRDKLLVWRQKRWPVSLGKEEGVGMNVAEATKGGNSIREGGRIASLAYFHGGGDAEVFHLEVLPRFQRKTIGTALVETALKELRGEAREVEFPFHEEREFYLKRGFGTKGKLFGPRRFVGNVRELGVKPAGIKLKVLWQRKTPRFAK